MSAEAYPLHWPEGQPRTLRPERSRFDTTLDLARRSLVAEIERLSGRNVVLSTNIELRRDGAPYASRRPPDDMGVAVYFLWKGKQMTFACDRWDKVKDNIQAIRKTIEAIRGIERWGASDMMERAFSAFEALPPPTGEVSETCWVVLSIPPGSSHGEIVKAYRKLAKTAHPNAGGTRKEWDRLETAREQAMGLSNG